jgi:ribosomal protein L7Ae-like RNA K-turn-binding protein
VPAIPRGFVVGAKAALRAVEAHRPVARVIVAADAPVSAVAALLDTARARALTLVEVPSSEELGRRCGLTRPVAAAAQLRSPGL